MNVGRFLANAAERDSDKAGFVWGNDVVPYREANARSDGLAGALRRFGLGHGERVGVLMPNCPQLLESMFATWKAGGCVVPLNARFQREELVYHLADPRARAVIFGEEYRETVAAVRDRVPTVERFICVGEPLPGQLAYDELVTEDPGPARDSDAADDDLAWLFYTSGTTGRPKGAMLTHGALTFVSVSWVADLMPLQPEDVGLHAAPLTHGAGFHALALTMKGATQVLLQAAPLRSGELLRHGGAAAGHERLAGAHADQDAPELPGAGEVGSVQPPVDRLRRVPDVCRGPQGGAAPDRAGVRPDLRPGRDPHDRHLSAA